VRRERQLEHLLDDRSIDSSGFPCGSDGTVSVAVRSACLPLAGDRPTPTLRGASRSRRWIRKQARPARAIEQLAHSMADTTQTARTMTHLRGLQTFP